VGFSFFFGGIHVELRGNIRRPNFLSHTAKKPIRKGEEGGPGQSDKLTHSGVKWEIDLPFIISGNIIFVEIKPIGDTPILEGLGEIVRRRLRQHKAGYQLKLTAISFPAEPELMSPNIRVSAVTFLFGSFGEKGQSHSRPRRRAHHHHLHHPLFASSRVTILHPIHLIFFYATPISFNAVSN
jgi:hypothetical protein